MTTTTVKKVRDSSNDYINNGEFLDLILVHQKACRKAKRLGEEKPICPNSIGECFIKIANKLGQKGNFINYSFKEDMILDAIENCLIYMDNFNPKKSRNPFSYFTTIAYWAFVRRIAKEKRQTQTKYRYIESLDIDAIIRQAHDEGDYSNNGFINYLKKQVDIAQTEIEHTTKNKKMTRKPKYLQDLDNAKSTK